MLSKTGKADRTGDSLSKKTDQGTRSFPSWYSGTEFGFFKRLGPIMRPDQSHSIVRPPGVLTLASTVARFRSFTLESSERKMQKSRDRHLITFPSRNRVSTHL